MSTKALNPQKSGAAALPTEAAKYEEFLNSRLKIDLNKAYKRKDMLSRRLRDFNETEAFIEKAEIASSESANATLKTQLDLGHQFFVSAEITEQDKIVLDVGLGVYVELTYKEARDVIFSSKQEIERLLRKVDIDIVDIKTNVKMFENTLSRLTQTVQ